MIGKNYNEVNDWAPRYIYTETYPWLDKLVFAAAISFSFSRPAFLRYFSFTCFYGSHLALIDFSHDKYSSCRHNKKKRTREKNQLKRHSKQFSLFFFAVNAVMPCQSQYALHFLEVKSKQGNKPICRILC